MSAAKRTARPKWICTKCLASYTWRQWPGSHCRCGAFSGSLATLEQANATGVPLPMSLSSPADPKKTKRWPTGCRGFDLALGGGAAKGCVALVAATAGSGKST
ncbi:MAG: hypothetical protein ACHREM_28755, partial [Polyangiales bacterium]